jgi:predicted RNase H-like HicB family nuclease
MELKYIYVMDDGFYVGHLDDYPEYTTQGEDIEDFEKNLMDIYEMVQDGTLENTWEYKGILRVAG